MEHEERADRMEEDAERMDEHAEQLGRRIDEIEGDWERKEQDPSVPGAQPDPDEEEPAPGVNTDEEVVSEEGGP